MISSRAHELLSNVTQRHATQRDMAALVQYVAQLEQIRSAVLTYVSAVDRSKLDKAYDYLHKSIDELKG